MPLPDEIVLFLDGPHGIAKTHLAEFLQDVLLACGYQVAPDPHHGFFTPAKLRSAPENMPPIRIVEYDEAVEEEIEVAEAIIAAPEPEVRRNQ